MAKSFAWSFSSIGSFETCPWRHFLTRVEKSVVEGETEATKWGKEAHKALEDRVRDGKPLPEILRRWEPYAAKFAASPGEVFVERQYCLNEHLKPTSWFAKDAWLRGVVDVGVLNGATSVAADWKTGKKKPESAQLMLFAGLMFHTHEELEQCNTTFIWMKEQNPLDRELFTRSQLPDIWGHWMPRVTRMQEAFIKERWPKKPSGLCRAWCPVGKSKCEHCGKP